jgi:DNA transposition AAA+ family ATPase
MKRQKRIKYHLETLTLRLSAGKAKMIHKTQSNVESLLRASCMTSSNNLEMKSYQFLQQSVMNNQFVGRESQLREIEEHMRDNSQRLCCVALCGLHGMGKTQIARRYIELHAESYPVIIWLNADSEHTLEGQFHRMAVDLNLCTDSGTTDRSRERVLQWLYQRGECLK